MLDINILFVLIQEVCKSSIKRVVPEISVSRQVNISWQGRAIDMISYKNCYDSTTRRSSPQCKLNSQDHINYILSSRN